MKVKGVGNRVIKTAGAYPGKFYHCPEETVKIHNRPIWQQPNER